jgi:tetratricopeptide (TPR) repeat protein
MIRLILLLLALSIPFPTSAQPKDPAALGAEIARLLQAGRYREAEMPARELLATVKSTLGPEHPYVATSLNNLAALLDAQGRYADAEPLYRRSLTIREKALGPEHPDVATSLNNLAALLDAQGRYADAEPLYGRSLAIREKALGPEHPDVAETLNNLARVRNNLARVRNAPGRDADAPVPPFGFLRRHAHPPPTPIDIFPAPPRTRLSGHRAVHEALSPPPIDDFPWPPPKPSSRYTLSAQILSAHKTVGEVAEVITAALEGRGYSEKSFYRAGNGGVVLVTRLEAIAGDGTPLPPPGRWNRVVAAPGGMASWIRGLFFAQPGFYRVIVFVIGGKAFSPGKQDVTPGMANDWLSGSVDKLPPELAERGFSADDSVWSLVYEFESSDPAKEVSTLNPGRLPARTHLDRSGVLALLENRRR